MSGKQLPDELRRTLHMIDSWFAVWPREQFIKEWWEEQRNLYPERWGLDNGPEQTPTEDRHQQIQHDTAGRRPAIDIRNDTQP